MREGGLPIVSIACVAVGLIDFNPSVQRFHVERCRPYLDLAYEYRGEEPVARAGRIHLGTTGDPAGRAMADRRAQRPRTRQDTPPISACKSPWNWSRFTCRWSTMWTHGALSGRRQSSGGAGEHRRFASAIVAASGRRNCVGSRARRSTFTSATATARSSRRSAAGPRRRRFRSVSARDQGPGHRRRRQHRAGVFAAAGARSSNGCARRIRQPIG